MKIFTIVLLLQMVPSLFWNSTVWATAPITPTNIEKQTNKFLVTTHYSVGGAPYIKGSKSNLGLVTFDIRAKGNTYYLMRNEWSQLDLIDEDGWVSRLPVAALAEGGEFFYRFEVKRSLVEKSKFRFHLGEFYSLNLGDWRSSGNPLTSEFKIRNACVEPGDTVFVDLTIFSSEQISLSVGENSSLGWTLKREDGTRVPTGPIYSTGMFALLNFEPGETKSFVIKVPFVQTGSLGDGSGKSPLDPGIYYLTCGIFRYEDLDLRKTLKVEVVGECFNEKTK